MTTTTATTTHCGRTAEIRATEEAGGDTPPTSANEERVDLEERSTRRMIMTMRMTTGRIIKSRTTKVYFVWTILWMNP